MNTIIYVFIHSFIPTYSVTNEFDTTKQRQFTALHIVIRYSIDQGAQKERYHDQKPRTQRELLFSLYEFVITIEILTIVLLVILFLLNNLIDS
jgi:hypothetical protein